MLVCIWDIDYALNNVLWQEDSMKGRFYNFSFIIESLYISLALFVLGLKLAS